ncbi:MAG: hypothetical protein DWQ42_13135 [Planctomycetota bacterium]|nr:MAG: hypothetical protein DWQ42_13135 [Planctomycetota bacterium]REK40167.1 MAG: hypothetical protein DWQ46_17060 [Planctomycetota bacterium]
MPDPDDLPLEAPPVARPAPIARPAPVEPPPLVAPPPVVRPFPVEPPPPLDRRRSGWVTSVAILNFLSGAAKIVLGVALTWVMISLNWKTPSPDSVLFLLHGLAFVVRAMMLVAGILVVGIGVVTVLAGYGVLMRRQWGRIVSLIVTGLVGFSSVSAVTSGEIGTLIGTVYPVFVYVILLMPRFAREFDEPVATEFGGGQSWCR